MEANVWVRIEQPCIWDGVQVGYVGQSNTVVGWPITQDSDRWELDQVVQIICRLWFTVVSDSGGSSTQIRTRPLDCLTTFGTIPVRRYAITFSQTGR